MTESQARFPAVFVLALFLMSALGSFAGGEDKDDQSELTKEEKAAVERINKILDSEVKIDCIESPIGDICRDVGKAHGIKVILDQAGFRRAGVAQDRPITINLKKISLRLALDMLLNPHKLTYDVRPDGVVITSPPKPAEEK